CGGVGAARPHRSVENAQPTRRSGGWDSTRVNEGIVSGGIRKVLHAVLAYALGELEGSVLLLGAPLVAREPRRLQIPAGAECLLERRGARVHRRAVRHRIDGQRARRVRVRERADTVGSHALGELHRLLPSGGVRVSAGAAGGAGAAGSGGGAGGAPAAPPPPAGPRDPR